MPNASKALRAAFLRLIIFVGVASLKNFFKSLGPGILFASTAIGVSHLVQSTRAGAEYGFALLWAVLLANLLKYPFFEFGSRYANATGRSLIDGYRSMGSWMLWLYFLVTLASMFFVAAAVGAVTGGFMHNLFQLEAMISYQLTVALLFAICLAILLLGQYRALDKLIKVIGSVLLISTLLATALALTKGPKAEPFVFFNPEVLNPQSAGFAFLIALMGWMPTAVDLSTWNSLWTLARIKESGYRPSLRETLREFNLGYWVSALLAPCFLLLGAYLLFGVNRSMPNDSAGFANAIVGLYVENMGEWSRLLITAAAFSIMFGTCIAVFDGYGRSLERTLLLLREPQPGRSAPAFWYRGSVAMVAFGALLIIFFFGPALKSLVDLATTISFLIAPVIALANYRLVRGKLMPKTARPGKVMRLLSVLGIVFLTLFSLAYLVYLLVY